MAQYNRIPQAGLSSVLKSKPLMIGIVVIRPWSFVDGCILKKISALLSYRTQLEIECGSGGHSVEIINPVQKKPNTAKIKNIFKKSKNLRNQSTSLYGDSRKSWV